MLTCEFFQNVSDSCVLPASEMDLGIASKCLYECGESYNGMCVHVSAVCTCVEEYHPSLVVLESYQWLQTA